MSNLESWKYLNKKITASKQYKNFVEISLEVKRYIKSKLEEPEELTLRYQYCLNKYCDYLDMLGVKKIKRIKPVNNSEYLDAA